MSLLLKSLLVALAIATVSANTDDLSFKDEVARDEDWLDPTNMFISKSSYKSEDRSDRSSVVADGDNVVVRPLSTRYGIFAPG